MRLLVTGAGGQLGGDVVVAASRDGGDVTGLTRAECDITSDAAIRAALDSHAPDAVVNCAGWTDVDGAEEHRAEAFAVNAEGPRLLATECASRRVLLLHVSTDYVFDGAGRSPIAEDAPAAPRSVYGASKLAGERAVRAAGDMHQIVRTSWLFGRDGPNFVITMLRLLESRPEVRVVDDQHGAPTWTGHLAPALLRLLRHGTPGTYHVTGSGETTWHGFATQVATLIGSRTRVTPVTTAMYGARAPRPAYSVLDDRAWRALGEAPLPAWQDGLRAYLAARGVTAERP